MTPHSFPLSTVRLHLLQRDELQAQLPPRLAAVNHRALLVPQAAHPLEAAWAARTGRAGLLQLESLLLMLRQQANCAAAACNLRCLFSWADCANDPLRSHLLMPISASSGTAAQNGSTMCGTQ